MNRRKRRVRELAKRRELRRRNRNVIGIALTGAAKGEWFWMQVLPKAGLGGVR